MEFRRTLKLYSLCSSKQENSCVVNVYNRPHIPRDLLKKVLGFISSLNWWWSLPRIFEPLLCRNRKFVMATTWTEKLWIYRVGVVNALVTKGGGVSKGRVCNKHYQKSLRLRSWQPIVSRPSHSPATSQLPGVTNVKQHTPQSRK